MKSRAFSVFVFSVGVLVTAQTALAQFNLPREIPQIMDALKGRAEQPKPAAPTQAPPAARENEPGSAFRTQGQPKAQDTPEAAANTSASLDNNKHYAGFRLWALNSQEPNPVPNMFKGCIDAYNEMIASGISPTTRVPEETRPRRSRNQREVLSPIVYSGTVQEIKENWCEAGLKKITGDVAARHAPYRAALKNDKLRLVIDETHGHVSSYAVAGGQYTGDAKRLAAASVWFLDIGPATNESQNCAGGGRKATVRRYAFDGQHNLTNTTSKQFCGSPPSSAYQ